eukprot:CAMPEP_0174269738 /NCGR_PEP_ID=MMETSP0439-20130205/42091_1 /TAXON_ID=0 /ORGANISM="Stereomyxa ramosa, Strain Chinc5" /LENGTH=309 /DNA_ID=CAMNT_0015358651 /DNA_START=246 /DNA_END=1172 /DNA_ORIENTATION=-
MMVKYGIVDSVSVLNNTVDRSANNNKTVNNDTIDSTRMSGNYNSSCISELSFLRNYKNFFDDNSLFRFHGDLSPTVLNNDQNSKIIQRRREKKEKKRLRQLKNKKEENKKKRQTAKRMRSASMTTLRMLHHPRDTTANLKRVNSRRLTELVASFNTRKITFSDTANNTADSKSNADTDHKTGATANTIADVDAENNGNENITCEKEDNVSASSSEDENNDTTNHDNTSNIDTSTDGNIVTTEKQNEVDNSIASNTNSTGITESLDVVIESVDEDISPTDLNSGKQGKGTMKILVALQLLLGEINHIFFE